MLKRFKPLARDIYSQLLYRLGLSSPSRIPSDALLILTFHRVLPLELRAEYPLPGLAVTPEELHWILATLLPHFENLTVSEAVRRHRHGGNAKAQLAVSFDDGQWDNLEYATPVLEALGVPATFYLPTDFIGGSQLLWHDRAAFAWQRLAVGGDHRRVLEGLGIHRGIASTSVGGFLEALKQLSPTQRETLLKKVNETAETTLPPWARLMDWAEVNQLDARGHEIGSHGCTHTLLPQLDREGQVAELEHSLQVIERFSRHAPVSFCYPNGSFDDRTPQIAEEVGYENAVTTRWGINRRDVPPFQLLRCDMDAGRLVDRNGTLSRSRLAMRVSGRQPGLAVH
ncbi:MAG: polysaccharide deacetylase family protein [Gammaproteobacteria bacterium]|nr:polysaccharide deacetylase family protein [Gammaproteobacteria bacterium]